MSIDWYAPFRVCIILQPYVLLPTKKEVHNHTERSLDLCRRHAELSFVCKTPLSNLLSPSSLCLPPTKSASFVVKKKSIVSSLAYAKQLPFLLNATKGTKVTPVPLYVGFFFGCRKRFYTMILISLYLQSFLLTCIFCIWWWIPAGSVLWNQQTPESCEKDPSLTGASPGVHLSHWSQSR